VCFGIGGENTTEEVPTTCSLSPICSTWHCSQPNLYMHYAPITHRSNFYTHFAFYTNPQQLCDTQLPHVAQLLTAAAEFFVSSMGELANEKRLLPCMHSSEYLPKTWPKQTNMKNLSWQRRQNYNHS